MQIDSNGKWKLYWGASPLPEGAKAIGTVSRETGDHGALILMPTGVYVQGNAGSVRNIDQTAVKKALGLPVHGGKRPGSGRPEIDNPRRQRQPIVATDDEWAEIKSRAKTAGKSINEYLVSRALEP